MAQPHRRVIREALPEMTADLLRAPPLPQQLADHPAELSVGLDLAAMLARSSGGDPTMSLEGAMLAAGCHVAP
jgi:hypothetical protein